MAQLKPRIGGGLNLDAADSDSTAVTVFVVFILVVIFLALLVVWFIFTIYLWRKGTSPFPPLPFLPFPSSPSLPLLCFLSSPLKPNQSLTQPVYLPARRNGITESDFPAKKIQRRAGLIVFTLGLIYLSKRFRARQRSDFGLPTADPGERGGVYAYSDPQMAQRENLGMKLRGLFTGKKREAEPLSTGFTDFEAVG
jgi:hypothetical protein